MLFFFGIGIFLSAKAQTYTWAENAACIFYTNCTKCHFPGGPGPFSLLDYGNAFAARYAIKQAILDQYMPPWPPDPNYRSFAHERTLTQQEKDIIVAWVDQGAPAGNLAAAPTPPSYSGSGSQMATIDWSGGIGNYTNTAVVDDYRNFYIPTNEGVDKFIQEIELVPGTRSMVHHVLIYMEEDTAGLLSLDAGDPGPGWSNVGGTGLSTSKLICTWVPGTDILKYPDGMGVLLPAGAWLVVQLHYPQSSTGDTDSNSVVNLKFASGPVREVTQLPLLDFLLPSQISPWPLYIGANAEADFTCTYTVPSVTAGTDYYTVLDVLPHMHQVGTSIKVYAVEPDNDTIPLCDIPNWDFKWQGQYSFRQPLQIIEGTVLKCEAHFNNTSSNPDAPNPNAAVWGGEASDEEMLQVYFSFLYYLPGDENIIVDTTTVKPTYMGCNFVGLEELAGNMTLTLYPNPASDVITMSMEQYNAGDLRISLMDVQGKMLSEFYQPNVGMGMFTKTIDVSTLPNGIYYLRIWSGENMIARPIIVSH